MNKPSSMIDLVQKDVLSSTPVIASDQRERGNLIESLGATAASVSPPRIDEFYLDSSNQ